MDSCECKGTAKRLYSYHNYLFEIPLRKVLRFTKENPTKILTNSDFIDSQGRHGSHGVKNNIEVKLSDFKGKLFHYFKSLLVI